MWPRPCYFVGNAAPSMVALFGAGIWTERAIFTAYIILLGAPERRSENFSVLYIRIFVH